MNESLWCEPSSRGGFSPPWTTGGVGALAAWSPSLMDPWHHRSLLPGFEPAPLVAQPLCQSPSKPSLLNLAPVTELARWGSVRPLTGQKESIVSSRRLHQSPHRKQLVASRALAFRRSPTWSETLIWSHIRAGTLGVSFRRQVPVAGNFVADFLASEVRLILEVDGGYHQQRHRLDAKRDAKLQRLGFTVLHLQAELVEKDLPEAIGRIRKAIVALTVLPRP